MTLMNDLIELISMGPFGSDIKVDNFISDGVPVLNGLNVSSIKLIETSFKYVSHEKSKALKKANAKRGDIVITHRGTVGQISYIPENSKYDNYVISQSQFRVSLKRDLVDPIFFTYYFHTDEGQKRLLSFKSHVGVPALAQATTNFRLLEFPLIHLEEQKKIAKVLSDLDAKIELNNKINDNLEQLAKTLYDYWFVQFDFPDANGKPYKISGGKMVWNAELNREIPVGWEVKKTEEIVYDIKTGLNPREHFKLGGGLNYYITIKNIEYGRISFNNSCDRIDDEAMERIQKRSNLEKGDILFTSIEPVGKTYLLSEKPINWNINESVFSFKPNYDLVSSEYLFMLLSSKVFNDLCKNASTGSIHKGIRITPMKAFKNCYPNNKILIDEFTKIVSPYLKLIDKNQKENQELASLRDWLLPMLMNGQVSVGGVEIKKG